jgi:hypothetical protein
MSLTDQPAAYRDCYELYRRAIDTPGGVRMPVDRRRQAATMFQLRMNKARQIEREFSRRAYQPGDPLYDRSEFDGLQVQVKGPDPEGYYWVYVRPHGRMYLLEFVEPISETEPEVLQLEHHPIIEGTFTDADDEQSDLE